MSAGRMGVLRARRVVTDRVAQVNPGDHRQGRARAIAPLQALIVLDNCEHVLHDANAIARTLMHNASGLRVLATTPGNRWGLPAKQHRHPSAVH